MMVRTLKAIGTLGAVQPFGPPKKFEYDPKDEEGLDLNQKCSLFVDRMEEEITRLTPMDDRQKKGTSR